MGPLLALVSTCFRETVNVTCKIVSFLCSLSNLLLKSEIVFFFRNQISKWRSFEKRHIFDPLFTFFSHHVGKWHKNSFSTYPTYIHTCILLTLLTFLPFQFLQKVRIYQVWFLFGVTLWCWFILEQSINNKMVAKSRLECLLLIFIYTNGQSIVICKPRTLNDGRRRLGS